MDYFGVMLRLTLEIIIYKGRKALGEGPDDCAGENVPASKGGSEVWGFEGAWVAVRVTAWNRIKMRVGMRIRIRVRIRIGGSVPVAAPDSVHSTCSELQLSHATTSYRYPS